MSASLSENVERLIWDTVEHITIQQDVYTSNSSEALPRRSPSGKAVKAPPLVPSQPVRAARYFRSQTKAAPPQDTGRRAMVQRPYPVRGLPALRRQEGETPPSWIGQGRRYTPRERVAGWTGGNRKLMQNPSLLPRSKTTSAGTSFAHMATPRLGPREWRSGLWTAPTPLQAAQRAKRSKRGFATNATPSLAATTSSCRATRQRVTT